MQQLTAIITFLNEGDEVEHTLQSIRNTVGDSIKIMLVNDCSTDGYDYERLSSIYNTEYIFNEKRQGVAQSRNIGVASISTPYFILLDAHMRFYDNDWSDILVKSLSNDDRALYCFACKSLDKSGSQASPRIGRGAYLSLYGNDFTDILEPQWITTETAKTNNLLSEVPCVLGATYSMSKRYWDYLKGLSMLKYYGVDEAYISLKVWLEGGRCIIVNNIVVGHIFRYNTPPPYNIYWSHSFFNKLLISETMLPKDYNEYTHAKLSNIDNDKYISAYAMLIKEHKEINSLRSYYESIFTRDFEFYKGFNEEHIHHKKSTLKYIYIANGTKQALNYIYNYLCKNNTNSLGFGVGGLGELLFMAQYAKLYDANELPKIKNIIDRLLEESSIKSHGITTGLSGVAIGLSYLSKYFPEFDIQEQFNDNDDTMSSIFHEKLQKQELSMLTGAIGIGLYFLERKNNKQAPEYIHTLITHINTYIDHKKNDFDKDMLFDIICFLLQAKAKGFDIQDSTKLINNLPADDSDFISSCVCSYFSVCTEENEANVLKSINRLKVLAKERDATQITPSRLGLYNGSATLVYIFHSMYTKSRDNKFKEAMGHWQEDILLKSISIIENNLDLDERQKSFFYGISGALFMFLSSQ